MIHVQNAAIANRTMMRAVGLPHVAHFAITASFGFVAHVKTPVWRDDSGVGHHALGFFIFDFLEFFWVMHLKCVC